MTTTIEEMREMRLPELWRRFTELTGEETRCPNKSYLLRRIEEAMNNETSEERVEEVEAMTEEAEESNELGEELEPEAAEEPEDVEETEGEASAAEGKGAYRNTKGLSVEELRALYLEIVGRETKSRDNRYLRWKIRQAERGLVPIGPRAARESAGEPINYRVLPLRLPQDGVNAMDEVWRRQGIKSRTAFFKKALHDYLSAHGEEEAAGYFG